MGYAENAKGELVAIQPERLLEMIDELHVTLPVKKLIISKIHDWTQPFVHGGFSRHLWEIEHAQHVLSQFLIFPALK